jgi:hypothetical protein
MTDTDAPPMSPQAQIVYRSMMEEFAFLKKSQWATTNYLVLIYAAIIWVGQHVEHSSWLSCVLSAIAIVAGLSTIGLLIRFQIDLGKLRKSADTAHAAYFSPHEREYLTMKPYDHPYGRGWEVLVALIAVSVFGAVLVVFALYLPQRS